MKYWEIIADHLGKGMELWLFISRRFDWSRAFLSRRALQ
jgi:hypothetical protein